MNPCVPYGTRGFYIKLYTRAIVGVFVYTTSITHRIASTTDTCRQTSKSKCFKLNHFHTPKRSHLWFWQCCMYMHVCWYALYRHL